MNDPLEELIRRDPRALAHFTLAMMGFRLFRRSQIEPERAAFWALEFFEFRERVLARQSVDPRAVDAVTRILDGGDHPELLGFPEPFWVRRAQLTAHRAAKAQPKKSGAAFGYQVAGQGRRVSVEGIREELERVEVVLDVASRRAAGASFEVACEQAAEAVGCDARTVSRHIQDSGVASGMIAFARMTPDGPRVLTDEERQKMLGNLAKLLQSGPAPAH